ncbi:MAG: HlyC/CorC family transporter [Alphaproteobacteria bacterium]
MIPDPTLTAIAIAILIMMSGFFSGSETALTAASRARMHRLAQDGDARAARVDRLKEDNEKLIGTILLGNNAVNILATALATSMFSALFGDYGVLIASGVMTLIVLIFAEVLPKTLAIRNPDQGAMLVSRPIGTLVPVLSPITNTIQVIIRGTLHLFGIDIRADTAVLSAHDELRGTIALHAQEGSMIKPHRDMLGSILDLDDIDVEEVMIHRRSMEMIDADIGAEAIVESVVQSPHTRIPLWRGDTENIIGILHAKDVLRAVRNCDGSLTMAQIEELAVEPWFVPETTSLREQMNAFRERQAHFALVVDEYGALMGVITLEDIIEEIVGDILDEFDEAHAGIRPQKTGQVVADGTTTIRDLNREMDWDLSDEHANTIAGYVIHEAQTIPDSGQAFLFHDYKFEVLKKERNQIISLRITPPEPEEPEDE